MCFAVCAGSLSLARAVHRVWLSRPASDLSRIRLGDFMMERWGKTEDGTYHAQPPTHLIDRPLLRVCRDISSENRWIRVIRRPTSGRICLFGKYVIAPDGPGGCCCDHSRKPYIKGLKMSRSATLVCCLLGQGNHTHEEVLRIVSRDLQHG